ncbi:hypothetical protein [Streptomyces sp. AJS327]|uniref:hypothetical protein n=1 Tax=Streptomyces sp. AJS327 TaxID=2545265 RepID=UPI0027E4C008|nr:hypothetical protein [Streptomyces sp. AJS327]
MTDLPHTRTRTVHWVLTAALVGAVVGASALVPSGDSTARASEDHSGSGGRAAPAAPDPRAANYPLTCGKQKPEVTEHGAADFDGDGAPQTVAVVRCPAGIGTPPHGVYVLAPAAERGAAPRVVATLVDPDEGMNVERFAVRDGTVSARLLGYSSPDVPRCCPDKRRAVRWEWKDGAFALVPGPVAGRTSV